MIHYAFWRAIKGYTCVLGIRLINQSASRSDAVPMGRLLKQEMALADAIAAHPAVPGRLLAQSEWQDSDAACPTLLS